MRVRDFDYQLPEDKIAKHPPKVRGASKLLVLDRASGKLADRGYSDVVDYLSAGDVVVLNDTKVIPARLLAADNTGKKHELLVLELHGHRFSNHGKCLYRGKLSPGQKLWVDKEPLVIEAMHAGGIATVRASQSLLSLAEAHGEVPLPPYMKRMADPTDTERYQTIFAVQAGSVAAPTASLNFTDPTRAKLEAKGVKLVYLTLHVGLGTFLPIRVDEVEKHKMHSEYYEISKETVVALQEAKRTSRIILGVGTTVTRTLEHCADRIINGAPTDLTGEADIFIYPGYEFKVVNYLLTNFHAPRSTVLMLTAAFAGQDNLKRAYDHALTSDYRFLSYGDSVLIL